MSTKMLRLQFLSMNRGRMKCSCCEREFDKQTARVMAEGYYKGMNVFVCPTCFSHIESWVKKYKYVFPPYFSIQFIALGSKLLSSAFSELVKTSTFKICYQEFKEEE